MYSELNRQLEDAQLGMYRLAKINQSFDGYMQDKKELQAKISELELAAKKEEEDVRKLENKNLTHLFYHMLGNMDEKLAKEQQEALAARLKLEQAREELEHLNHEISNLSIERRQYQHCSKDYERLYEEKKAMLMRSDEKTALKIIQLTDTITKEKNNKKEIREAMIAGEKVIASLNKILASLDSAKGWGTWDMLGGGLISDLAKHSHIDDAKNEVSHTQSLLRNFKSELADISLSSSIQIEIGGFAKFADFFFDGLIADWYMQDKIRNSRDSVSNVKNQVEMVLNKLHTMDLKEDELIYQTEEGIKKYITKQQ